MSASAYAVGGGNAAASLESADTPAAAAKAELRAYLDALGAARVHPAGEVFSAGIACSNRLFLGIRSLGPDPAGACSTTKYWTYHQMLLASFVLAFVPPLYVAGAGWSTSLFLPILLMAPMTLSTPFPESRIFGSPFLSLCIQRGGKRIEELRRGTTCYSLVFFLFTSILMVGAILGASIFWVYPWAVDRGDLVLQWLVLSSIIVAVPVQIINFGFQCWQPLAEMHQQEVLAAVARCADGVQAVLFDRTLSATDARAELAELTHRLVRPLQKDLIIWGNHAFCMVAWQPVLVGTSLWLVLMQVDPLRADVSWPGDAFRWVMGLGFGVFLPLAMWPVVKAAAKPHHAWSTRIEDSMLDAEKLASACAKFDGNHGLLREWLRKNRLTLRFAGLPVDDTLPGKLAAGLASAAGGVLVVFVRSMGWA